MSRSTLPPPHPSLPRLPSTSHSNLPFQQPQAQPTISYAFPTYYSSHYAQAYTQTSAPTPSITATAGGYLNPNALGGPSRPAAPPVHTMSTWYQSGSNRCSHPGCAFSGSQKTVEIHMMDRHLIYPAGWDKRKKKQDWDADPSLKGKPIPIQGTNVILDSPEVLAAWIAERKKRFPSAARVEDKKRKMDEAIARGQLDLSATGSRKRRRVDGQTDHDNRNQHHTPRGRNGRSQQSTRGRNSYGKDSGPGRVADTGWPRKQQDARPALHIVAAKPEIAPTTTGDIQSSCDETSCDECDDDDAPEAISSKISTNKPGNSPESLPDVQCGQPTAPILPWPEPRENKMARKPVPQQPRPPPRNPFASRPTLLRNLLLPEIRMTVSNLSQAIRFLVDNDFLRDVELKPGQAADQHKIQVLETVRDSKESNSAHP